MPRSPYAAQPLNRSFASDDTNVLQATWTFWPNPPSGHDFCRLIPDSDASKAAFQQQVKHHLERREKGKLLFCDRFLHYEYTTPELAFPAPIEYSSASDLGDGAAPVAILDKAAPNTIVPTSLPPATEMSGDPCVTGYYRLNMASPAPQNHGIGWRLGAGRSSEPGIDIEFRLASRKSGQGLHGIHGRLKRSLASGALLAISDTHRIRVGDDWLQGVSNAPSERTLMNGSTLDIAGYLYRVEYTDISPSLDRKQLTQVAADLDVAVGAVLLTPTPANDASGVVTTRDYIMHPAFSSGASATVFYAVSRESGEVYAAKKVTAQHSGHVQMVKKEVALLKDLQHPHIIKLVDVSSSAFEHHDCPSSAISEHLMMLQPALTMNLLQYSKQIVDDSGGRIAREQRTQASLLLLSQIGHACDYLHRRGVMHRDIKPDNIGVSIRSSNGLDFILLDFGHATKKARSQDHLKGTMRYLAPEIMDLKNGKTVTPYDHAVDVWALGLSSLELLHGIQIRDVAHAMNLAVEVRRSSQSRPSTRELGEHDDLERSALRLHADMLQQAVTKRIKIDVVIQRAKQGLDLLPLDATPLRT